MNSGPAGGPEPEVDEAAGGDYGAGQRFREGSRSPDVPSRRRRDEVLEYTQKIGNSAIESSYCTVNN